MGLDEKIEFLKKNLEKLGRVAIALSGGLDSSLLLYYASRVLGPENVVAVTIDFPYIHRSSIESARRVASFFGVRHFVVRDESVMREPEVMINGRLRCYYCKKRMFKLVWSVARREGLDKVVDGTNQSDFKEYRPGIKALIEENVVSPLAIAGFSKEDVREAAVRENLPFKNKAPNTCLLTRIPYNNLVFMEDLKRIEAAEELLIRRLGVGFVRVRMYFDSARIEFLKNDLVDSSMRLLGDEELVKKLRNLGFKHILIDCEGYRTT